MKGKHVLVKHVKKDDLPKALAFLDMMKVPYETKDLKSRTGFVSVHACFEQCSDPSAAQIAWQQFVFGR